MGDDEYELLTRFYDYDPVALEALTEAEDTSEFWIRQRVSYTAAYSGERVVAFVFLPRNVEPPYRSVVFSPGLGAFVRRSSVALADEAFLTFVPRSGRALVYPIYKGSHERFIENRRPGTAAARQRMVWVTQDLRRTVDYIVERADLAADPIGYMGISYGGEIVIPYALEPRIDALVLIGAAFDAQWLAGALPETAPWNFAPRVTAPALIINGRNDFQHPFETGQIPFFNALGTPDADKDTVITEAGHLPAWNDIIRHSLRWFDRYLGPVDQLR